MKTAIFSTFLLCFSFSSYCQVCVDSSLIDPFGFCILIWDPVCACDDITYSNTCFAEKSGGATYWIGGGVTCDDVANDCLAPARSLQSTLTATGVLLEWERPIANAAIAYRVQGRPAGSSSWQNSPVINAPVTQLNVPGNALLPGTVYEWRVQASCAPLGVLLAPNSDLQTFTTPAPRQSASIDFNLYPNPANSSFTLMHNSSKPVDMTVYDQTGRIVRAVNINDQTGFAGYNVVIETLPDGIYTVQLTEGSKTESIRLAVVH